MIIVGSVLTGILWSLTIRLEIGVKLHEHIIRFVDNLKQELDVALMDQTTLLYKQITKE